MQDCDVALKSVLGRLRGSVLEKLTVFAIESWHNVELSTARTLRVDMLGETASGELVHIELQSSNHPNMPLRMAEYALAIFREYGRFPDKFIHAGSSRRECRKGWIANASHRDKRLRTFANRR